MFGNVRTGAYASKIEGVRLFRRKELSPFASVWEFQVTENFTPQSAQRVFTELPNGCEVSCFSFDERKEEAYYFVCRSGGRLLSQRGGHGWLSQPKEESIDHAIEVLLESPFVKKPNPEFESFSITKKR